MCETWKKKIDDEDEYEKWKTKHQDQCTVNDEGSAGKMEVDGIKEMFGRSMERYGALYTRYIGNGDSKTFKDTAPQHDYRPIGADSWCSWRRVEAEGTLKNYTHDPPLTDLVQQVIKPIYTDLSRNELLERCLGRNTQNNNESFNGLLWHFAPKHVYSGAKTVKIAAYLASGIFNDGYQSILKTINTMGIIIGSEIKGLLMLKTIRESYLERKGIAKRQKKLELLGRLQTWL
ncbi:uncharacterized protein LOC128879316 [Hylaeus volcanicus]|uniref:uncharacterized protein LOC128879316 n=1 Tax=Hylaeus volcanicus TaxID=313075 RepID=UPI0023B83E16|nr:uncharacterized protein LOC128879316 [Hylaeus volcanicus]